MSARLAYTIGALLNAALAALNVSTGHYGTATFSALACVIICAYIAADRP